MSCCTALRRALTLREAVHIFLLRDMYMQAPLSVLLEDTRVSRTLSCSVRLVHQRLAPAAIRFASCLLQHFIKQHLRRSELCASTITRKAGLHMTTSYKLSPGRAVPSGSPSPSPLRRGAAVAPAGTTSGKSCRTAQLAWQDCLCSLQHVTANATLWKASEGVQREHKKEAIISAMQKYFC